MKKRGTDFRLAILLVWLVKPPREAPKAFFLNTLISPQVQNKDSSIIFMIIMQKAENTEGKCTQKITSSNKEQKAETSK